MTFEEILDQALAMLQRRGRVTYRTLQRQFDLDEAALEDLKDAIRFAHPQVVDEAGQGLVWPTTVADQLAPVAPPPAPPIPSEAERRQLTVMFCDLADSTRLASQLDPEDLREVIRAYQAASAGVIQRFDGSIAQYLGDGVLVYFGYPQAHEDDAQRAIRASLGILDAMGPLNTRLERHKGVRLAVRIGIHTGPVVVGEIGGGGRYEQLALGETPNIAARLQGMATPNTVVVSDATLRLVEGYFAYADLGLHALKGVETSLRVSRIVGESGTQTRLEVTATRGLTPLVGREHDVEVLLDRWAQAREGLGQVVVLSGEAGIGKSRLLQVLKDYMAHDAHTQLECRSSPYYQHTALYPVTELWERVWAFTRDDTPPAKLAKMAQALSQYRLELAEAVPLLAPLFALPLPDDCYAPLTLSPQRQRQKTLATLLTMVVALTEQQPLLCIIEDLHWVDPSTLEWLTLLIDHTPTSRLCLLLTCRPTFQPPWGNRSYLTQLTLTRLTQLQVEQMVERLAGGKALPPEVIRHLVEKSDGVPLYIEEMTRAILESGLLRDMNGQYELVGSFSSLAIPATLQDSLMARLDRLGPAKGVAQVGATIGRQFAYELLQAVSPLDEETLQRELGRLVDAELVYQSGIPPRAIYMFKHALIQDAAYQSLLRTTRQQYHQRIAQVLEAQFPEVAALQPELLAYHYTEAGLSEQAIASWYQAGQQASMRSAYVEAIARLTRGLEVLRTRPETAAGAQHELIFQHALGQALTATHGYAAPEVADAYNRARALAERLEESTQLAQVLYALWGYYVVRGELRTAYEVGEQLLQLAQRLRAPALSMEAHWLRGIVLSCLGDLQTARTHLDHRLPTSTPPHDNLRTPRDVTGTRITGLAFGSWGLWCLGYPDQARASMHETLDLTHEFAHPFTLAFLHGYTALLYRFRREPQSAQVHAEAAMTLANEQGFAYWVAWGTMLRGWARMEQGQADEGSIQLQQGLASYRASGTRLHLPWFLPMLVEMYGERGDAKAGLTMVAEALALVDHMGGHQGEAELYRLKGELLLKQTVPEEPQAETCFQQALDIARHQQAKSLELRAAMSLARLWQQQGKCAAARQVLAEVYGWFTEGFDTADLQEAAALLEALA
jgi:class 3 adenylate cyclase/predicted ATPase